MDLKTRAIKSTAWYAGTRIWQQGLSWIVTILLARYLVPADYGLFGMAFTVITFLELLQQFGLGAAIIQRQQVSRQQLNAIFWMVNGTGLGVAVLVCALAPILARFYEEPRLLWVVRILAAIFLLDALGMVPYNVLTKEIDFRRRSLAEASGVIASAGVSLALAYGGMGVWALVVGQLVRAAVRNVALLMSCGWLPGLDLSLREMRSIVGFGVRVAMATVFRELSIPINTAIVARFLGPQALGLFSMASTLGMNPFNKLSTAVVNQLSLPVFSKLQNDDEAMRRSFLKVTKYLAVMTFPMQVGIALVAHDLVLLLLSSQWLEIVALLQVICISGIWYILPLPSTPVLTARGRVKISLGFNASAFVVSALACLIGVRYGILGVAWAAVLSYCPMRTILLGLSLAELKLPVRTYLKTVAAPALAAAAMVGVVLAARALTPDLGGALPRLMRDIAAGAAGYSGALLLLDRALGVELLSMGRIVFAGTRP